MSAKTSASFGASISWPAATWGSRIRWTKSGTALTTVISVSFGDSRRARFPAT
ncbi:hypothetical protein [Nonomuraea guangzhouensis]|uniref:Uncharacterized protein n=1 Tax=Nonomuraea guangzhouensis TaxID=1291555 RepID=A0ABW4GQ07_9ACTN